MGISRGESSPPLLLSALGEACSRNDLTAVHDILLKTGYKDDEGADNEVLYWSYLSCLFDSPYMHQIILLSLGIPRELTTCELLI